MLLVDLLERVGRLAGLAGIQESQSLVVEKVWRLGRRLLRVLTPAEAAGQQQADKRQSDKSRRKAAEKSDGIAVLHKNLPGFAGRPESPDIRHGVNVQAVQH
jgi:hypothetical protein